MFTLSILRAARLSAPLLNRHLPDGHDGAGLALHLRPRRMPVNG